MDAFASYRAAGCALSFRDWTGGRDVISVGTDAGSLPIPFQRWRSFQEAFAPELIEHALAEMKRPVRHIVDPFGGSGTTGPNTLNSLACGRPSSKSIRILRISSVKLARYDINIVRDNYAWLMDHVSVTTAIAAPYFPGAAKTFVRPGVGRRYLFSKRIARRIAIYKQSIDPISDPNVLRLFMVILGSVVVALSNVVVSGKGRRYRRGWENRPQDPIRLDSLFRQTAEGAIYDLRRYEARLCRDYTVLRGDARTLLESIEGTELAVFSPPYPNSFVYTDVYNVELWTLGYLDSSGANLALRNATLRSHVQIARDMSGSDYPSKLLRDTVARLQKTRSSLWNRRIPDMVSAYISDMGDVLAALKQKLCRGGRVYMVVGDSRYAGVHVPVAAILAEVAPAVGMRVRSSEPFRSMRVSPQQGGQHGLAESLLVLQRPLSYCGKPATRASPADPNSAQIRQLGTGVHFDNSRFTVSSSSTFGVLTRRMSKISKSGSCVPKSSQNR